VRPVILDGDHSVFIFLRVSVGCRQHKAFRIARGNSHGTQQNHRRGGKVNTVTLFALLEKILRKIFAGRNFLRRSGISAPLTQQPTDVLSCPPHVNRPVRSEQVEPVPGAEFLCSLQCLFRQRRIGFVHILVIPCNLMSKILKGQSARISGFRQDSVNFRKNTADSVIIILHALDLSSRGNLAAYGIFFLAAHVQSVLLRAKNISLCIVEKFDRAVFCGGRLQKRGQKHHPARRGYVADGNLMRLCHGTELGSVPQNGAFPSEFAQHFTETLRYQIRKSRSGLLIFFF